MATFSFLQLMHMDVEYSRVLIKPLLYHGITTSPPRQSTAVLLETVPRSTKYTYYLFTRSSTDALHPPVTLLDTVVSDGQSGRPIVLVFASYQPVNWIVNSPAGLIICKVILVSTHKQQKENRAEKNHHTDFRLTSGSESLVHIRATTLNFAV